MLQDLRFSLRNLYHNPGFAAVAILTLALGIGANTAIFSVVNAVLLQPLPYPDPDRLLAIEETGQGVPHRSVALPNYFDWREQSHSFQSLTAFATENYTLTGVAQPENVTGLKTTAGFFEQLGARPALGRFYAPADDKPGAPSVVVLSYGFWQRMFHGDPGVLGRVMHLDGVGYTTIGVAAAGFHLTGRERDLFIPLGSFAAERMYTDRGNHPGIRALGRLKPGVTIEQARAECSAIAARLAQQYPLTNAGEGVRLERYSETIVSDSKPTLRLLLAAVAFVLLTACANVANLLLARGSSRQREISIRSALGASRGQVIRQLLVESLVLAMIGGAIGCLLAAWGVDTLLKFGPKNIPRLAEAHLDLTVLAFTFGISMITGIVFGMLPAWRLSRPDLVQELKTGGRGSTVGRSSQRLRSTLLIAEVALALLMVSGGGLMLRSILSLQNVNPGFKVENAATFGISLSGARYKGDNEKAAFYRLVLERVGAIPGVELAGLVNCVPLDGGCWGSEYSIEGRPVSSNDQLPHADFNNADPDYFRTLEIPVLEGRVFTGADTKDSAKVVVINRTLARHIFPGESPLGKTIRQGFPQEPSPAREIVGVVGDVQRYELDHTPVNEIYIPVSQDMGAGFDLVVRTKGDSMSYARVIQDVIHDVDKDQPLATPRSMQQLYANTLASRKFSTILLGIFAALALGLAAVGIYGVTAYSVTLRTQEVGIRMALGARQADVLKSVLGQGLGLALAGVAVGLAASVALTWLLASVLYGVAPRDPLTLAAASAMLVAVALAASYLPARRASRLDPMVALRVE